MSVSERIIALAGRRIDAADASDARFPLSRIPTVEQQLRKLFRSTGASTLVCSAANGADLVALRVAGRLGMRRRVVLPFAVRRFREVSVVDRDGGELWGWLFDDLIEAIRAHDDLVILRGNANDNAGAFEAANTRIIDEAVAIARHTSRNKRTSREVVGVAVWEGKSRGDGDTTALFVQRLESAGIPLHTVLLSDNAL